MYKTEGTNSKNRVSGVAEGSPGTEVEAMVARASELKCKEGLSLFRSSQVGWAGLDRIVCGHLCLGFCCQHDRSLGRGL